MGHIHGADGALGNAPDGVLIGVIAAEELVDQVPDRLIGILDLRGNDVGILGIGQVNVLTGGVEALLLGGLEGAAVTAGSGGVDEHAALLILLDSQLLGLCGV